MTRTVGVPDYGRWALEYDDLVHRALARDEAAWRSLVDRLSGVVWKVVNSFDLDTADRDEVFASTFFRLFQKLDTIREPQMLPGWVATTARNEANAVWRSRKRHVPMAELPLRDQSTEDVSDALLDGELTGEVLAAFRKLPAAAQALLRLLTAVPPLSYDEISVTLTLPRGSIGPMAGRALKQLRGLLRSYSDGTQ